jgi:MtN3 and saliva related transmembrane protein
MDWITIIGSIAAAASVASFAPQAWRIIRTRETKGLSARMYALTVLAFALWLTFGILKGEWPIIVPNALCLLLAGFILAMLIMPRRMRAKVADALDPAA